MMRCVPCEDDGDESCANCGKLGSDAVKLKNCTACRLVKYCGVDCQRAHRKQHRKACKQRVAELKDEQLYSQGHERPEGDYCPICSLPIPFRMDDHSAFNVCCMKRICNGCNVAAQKRGMHDCAFCRTPIADNEADTLAMVQARVQKKDPQAILFLGRKYFFGELLQMDKRKGVEMWTEAAELGSLDALFSLGVAHARGEGVGQDMAKAAEFYTKAATQGHVESRNNLGSLEGKEGNYDRAVRHYLISAKMGHKDSVENIKRLFMAGIATNEQYAAALKGYQNAVEETKSHDRDTASALIKKEVVPTAGGEREREEQGASLDERVPRLADDPERHDREQAQEYQAGPDEAVDALGPRGTPVVEHRAPQDRLVPTERREQRGHREDAPEEPQSGALTARLGRAHAEPEDRPARNEHVRRPARADADRVEPRHVPEAPDAPEEHRRRRVYGLVVVYHALDALPDLGVVRRVAVAVRVAEQREEGEDRPEHGQPGRHEERLVGRADPDAPRANLREALVAPEQQHELDGRERHEDGDGRRRLAPDPHEQDRLD
ncbi:hypothetical protein THAOC_37735, partial [Thalassiosira oceanica]